MNIVIQGKPIRSFALAKNISVLKILLAISASYCKNYFNVHGCGVLVVAPLKSRPEIFLSFGTGWGINPNSQKPVQNDKLTLCSACMLHDLKMSCGQRSCLRVDFIRHGLFAHLAGFTQPNVNSFILGLVAYQAGWLDPETLGSSLIPEFDSVKTFLETLDEQNRKVASMAG